MSGNEVHIEAGKLYLAPSGTKPPTSATDLAAGGWLEFGHVEDDGFAITEVTETRQGVATDFGTSKASLQLTYMRPRMLRPERPVRYTNRAARRAAKRGKR